MIESDGYRLHDLIKNHIKNLGYIVLDHEPSKAERMKYDKIVKFNSTVSYPAFRTDIDSDLGKWLSKALKNTFGVEPVLRRTSGGSVPISPFVNVLNIPAVGVPTVNKDNNQHSPNENIRLTNYIRGIETFIGILSSKLDYGIAEIIISIRSEIISIEFLGLKLLPVILSKSSIYLLETSITTLSEISGSFWPSFP